MIVHMVVEAEVDDTAEMRMIVESVFGAAADIAPGAMFGLEVDGEARDPDDPESTDLG